MQEYKYLTKPLLGVIMFFFIGTELLRSITNLSLLTYLIIKSYEALQSTGKIYSLTYLTRFWILFSTILIFELLLVMITGTCTLPFLSIMNTLKLSFITWLFYNPDNVNVSFSYIVPFLNILFESYNKIISTISKFDLF